MGIAYSELAKHSDALLQGRRTYQLAGAWPSRSGDPFSDWINRVQKYVPDTLTEKDITWNPTTIIRGDDFVKTVSDLRARPGGYIYVYGSPTMVRSLLEADLVDELLLTIEPLILGGGKRSSPRTERQFRSRWSRPSKRAPGRRCADMRVLGSRVSYVRPRVRSTR